MLKKLSKLICSAKVQPMVENEVQVEIEVPKEDVDLFKIYLQAFQAVKAKANSLHMTPISENASSTSKRQRFQTYHYNPSAPLTTPLTAFAFLK